MHLKYEMGRLSRDSEGKEWQKGQSCLQDGQLQGLSQISSLETLRFNDALGILGFSNLYQFRHKNKK